MKALQGVISGLSAFATRIVDGVGLVYDWLDVFLPYLPVARRVPARQLAYRDVDVLI